MRILVGEWLFINSVLRDVHGQVLEDPGLDYLSVEERAYR